MRGQLAFSVEQLSDGLSRVGCCNIGEFPQLRELVILSTCNRVELYALSAQASFGPLEAFLSEMQGVPVSAFAANLYRLRDEQVIGHLMTVVAGLDSVVVGEPQILGQVTAAYELAQKFGSAGKVLARLFQQAIHAGKRARTETAIGQNPASIASVAAHRIAETISDFVEAKILVIGAGEMAELAVEALRKRGACQITVVNRTIRRAQELAQRWDGQAAALDELQNLLVDADIVIASTGAAQAIVGPAMVAQAMALRPCRPLIVMDIAVPRNVEPGVGEIPGVRLFDMDTLSTQLESCLSRRMAEIPHVKEILLQEQAVFVEYLNTLEVLPIITKMRAQADAIRRAELEKTIRRIPDLPPGTEQRIDLLTKAIVNKILHSPTTRLREEAVGPNALGYADAARLLFGLE
jgi:glutamyl-tRNA reductase